jgi:hypothetical protein
MSDLDAVIRDPDGRALLELLCGLRGWGRRPLAEVVDHLVAWFRFWTAGVYRTAAVVEVLAREAETFPRRFARPAAQRALKVWQAREYRRALASATLSRLPGQTVDDVEAAARQDVDAVFSCLIADALVDTWRTASDPQRVSVEEDGRRLRAAIPAALPLPDLFRWLRTRVLDLVARRIVAQMSEIGMTESKALADLYGRSLVYDNPGDVEPPAEVRLAEWIKRAQLTPTERDVLAAMLDPGDRKLALHLLTLRHGWEPSTVRRHALNLRRKLHLTR